MTSQLARVGFQPNVTWDPQVAAYFQAVFGADAFGAISTALCRPPPATCLRVNTLRASLQEALAHVISVTEHLAAGDGAGDWSHSSAPFIHALAPAIIMPGRGPLDVDYSRADGKEVVISRKAGEAVLRGAPVYIPGVLACSPGVEAGDLVAVSVALEKPGSQTSGITRGTVIGSEAWQRAGAPDRSGLYIGLGRCKVGRTELFRAESGTAVDLVSPVFQVPSCKGLEGKVMLQNLPSVIAAMALAPAPGSRVLDMCAAPGGKTTMLAQLMGDKGEVVALDRSHAKAAEITSLASELGMSCIKAFKMDATKAVLTQQRQQRHVQQQGQANGGGFGQQQEQWQQADSAEQQQQQQEHGGLQAAEDALLLQMQRRRHLQRQQRDSGDTRGALTECNEGPAETATGSGAGVQRELRGDAKVLKRQHRKAAAMAARGLQSKQAEVESQEPSPPGFPPESFDHILVDASCSALGLRPRLLQSATLNYLHQCASYQRRILRAAVALLRPGGTLVYSTCTFNPGENEANVRHVLDTYPCMELVQQAPRVGGPGLVGEHPGPAHLLSRDTTDKHGSQQEAVGSPRADGVQGKDAGSLLAAAGCSSLDLSAPPQQEHQHDKGQPPQPQQQPQQQQQLLPPECEQLPQERQEQHQSDPATLPASPGHHSISSSAVREVWLSEAEAAMVQRFDPTGETIAFFIAKFRKRGAAA